MPIKPVRRGLKVWMRADGITGYVSQFQVYIDEEVSSETGLEARVIKDLTSTLLGKHSATTSSQLSNYFTNFTGMVSMPLAPLGQTGMASLRPVLKTHVKKGLRERIRNSKVKSTLTSQFLYGRIARQLLCA